MTQTFDTVLSEREGDQDLGLLERYTLDVGDKQSIKVFADTDTGEAMLRIDVGGITVNVYLSRTEAQDMAVAVSTDLEQVLAAGFTVRSLAISPERSVARRNTRPLPIQDITALSDALEPFRWSNRRVLIPSITRRLRQGATR